MIEFTRIMSIWTDRFFFERAFSTSPLRAPVLTDHLPFKIYLNSSNKPETNLIHTTPSTTIFDHLRDLDIAVIFLSRSFFSNNSIWPKFSTQNHTKC
jgi:hypothetical protein